jgi:hypothetical protein
VGSSSDTDIGFCITCRYPLVGNLLERCSECSRPFSLTDNNSYANSRSGAVIRRWLERPFAFPDTLILVGAALLTFWACTAPGLLNGLAAVASLFWFASVFVAGIRLVERATGCGRWSGFSAPRFWLGMTQLPALVIGLFVLSVFAIPERIAFALGRRAFENAVTQAKSGPFTLTAVDTPFYRATAYNWPGHGVDFRVNESKEQYIHYSYRGPGPAWMHEGRELVELAPGWYLVR